MDNELEQLRKRVKHLEAIETEYQQMCRLVEEATANQNLDVYAGSSTLTVNSSTGQILEANPQAATFLGLALGQLIGRVVSEFEVIPKHTDSQPLNYVETAFEATPKQTEASPSEYVEVAIEKQIYECFYRHADGRLLPVRVHKRHMTQEGDPISHYWLEDLSQFKRLWLELSRREDSGFQFREKLKAVNEINLELSGITSFHDLCRRAVELGSQRLGFDRLSLWFWDSEARLMVGSYGMDERGEIRDERGSSWRYGGTHVDDFISGRRPPVITQDKAPIYNNQSQIIGYGWHISVPLLHEEKFIGFMAADNYINQQSMKAYEPELLRIYGTTIGHLTAHQRNQEAAQQLTDAVHLKQAQIQMLETFITHVGHDFRTPLTIIGTNAYLLTRSKDEARKAELAQGVQEQVTYINRIIKQMLEVIEFEKGVEFTEEPLDLSLIVRQTAQSLNALAVQKQLVMEIQADTSVLIHADEEWVESALREILKNAIQNTEAGGRLTVGLFVYDNEVGIRVQDTGIGIAEEHLDKIFESLYRVDQARTHQGVGLGLTLAKQVVEAHGGRITVKSAVGHGSTFEIILPR